MNKLKLAKILVFSALVIHIISLFLPYNVKMNYGGANDSKEYEAGMQLILPPLAIVLFVLILFLHFLKHSLATKIITTFFTVLLIFPGVPYIWLVTIFCMCESKFNIGFYLFAFAVIIVLIALILKLITKIDRPNPDNAELIDTF